MTTHETSIRRQHGKWVAVCTCRRWRSSPFGKRTAAVNAGEAHMVRGDEQVRALAQFNRGRATQTSLRTELRWYEEQAEDPLNTPEEQKQWRMLADEIRPRVKSPEPDEAQQELF